MIKLCRKSIVYPLKLIFEASLQGGEFPDYSIKVNVVPVHKFSEKLQTNKPYSDFWKNIWKSDIQGLIRLCP